MNIKLFEKNIDNDRFYLMIFDTLDAFIDKDDPKLFDNVERFTQNLKKDIDGIIDEAVGDWIECNTKTKP